MDKRFYIYEHRRSDTGSAFYVGKGSGSRAWDKLHRSKWWKSIAEKHGYTVHILHECISEHQAFTLERDIISAYGRDNLCNMTDGGEGNSGGTRSNETKEKLRQSKIGCKNPNFGKKLPQHVRDEMSRSRRGENAYWYGKNHSDETIEKIRIASSGRRHSEETKAKISEKSSGKKCSDDTKRKISESKIGKPRPRHVVQAIIDAHSKKITTECGLIFSSGAYAVRWLKQNGFPNASAAAISRSAKSHNADGIWRVAYGFKWKFSE